MANEQKIADAPNSGNSEIKRVDVKAVNKAEERSLYAPRKKIHPQRAKGKFRSVKWFMMIFLRRIIIDHYKRIIIDLNRH